MCTGCVFDLGARDGDLDGFTGWVDCDDRDAAINPDALELCDGVDNDCDGVTDGADAVDAGSWFPDDDGDGYGAGNRARRSCTQPPGHVGNALDCNDQTDRVHPGVTELCNGIDDDCDQEIDEDALGGRTRWYQDQDQDGFGNPEISFLSCDMSMSGYVLNSEDCQDVGLDAADTWPGAAPQDSETGCLRDVDGDGWGEQNPNAPGVGRGSDCDDHGDQIHPGADETCDFVDEDCDGLVDEDAVDKDAWYRDADGDRYGFAGDVLYACEQPDGYVDNDADSDDGSQYPAAACLWLVEDGRDSGSGLYRLDFDGPAGSAAELELFCEMDFDGGGWTLVQRSLWSWDETEQLRSNYADWRTLTVGHPAPGYAYRLAGMAWPFLNQARDHLFVHTARDSFDGGDCLPMFYLGSGGALSVDLKSARISGLSSDVIMVGTGTLSTPDSGPYPRCTTNPNNGIPWFYGASCGDTCPSLQGTAWLNDSHPMADYLDVTPDYFGRLVAERCPSGAPVWSEFGTGDFEGINIMEYYLR